MTPAITTRVPIASPPAPSPWPYDVAPGLTRLLIIKTRHLGLDGPAAWVDSVMSIVEDWPADQRPDREEVSKAVLWDMALPVWGHNHD